VESIDFDGTDHIFIEGDNLEVLKLLYKPYFGKAKMIYIDPPFNTGNDFVYHDDYADPLHSYLELTAQKDAEGNLLTSNPERSGRYHSSWLSMMYPRLFYARLLLRDDGAICVSIGEEELANLRLIMNDIFGEENYRNTILVRRYDKNINRQFMEQGLSTLNVGAEYVLVYGRTSAFTLNPVYRAASEERQNFGYWKGFWNAANRPTMRYELLGATPETGQWKWKKEVALEAVQNYLGYNTQFARSMTLEEYWGKTGKSKRFIRRTPNSRGKSMGVEHWIPPSTGILRSSNWTDMLASDTLSEWGLEFDNPKSVGLIKELVRMCSDENDTIIDFFAGSCSTAQAVLELNKESESNRRFIMVQLPEPTAADSSARKNGFETIAEIGKERIRRVIASMKKAAATRRDPSAKTESEDLGLRIFKLAESNYKPWKGVDEKTPEKYAAEMEAHVDSLVNGWKPENVIYEVATKEGLELTSRIEREKEYQDNEIWRITDPEKGQSFMICLDDKVKASTVRHLEIDKDQTFVCRDIAIDDTIAANLALQCRLKTI
jgi:adenine-specific DNA-methyltransferase